MNRIWLFHLAATGIFMIAASASGFAQDRPGPPTVPAGSVAPDDTGPLVEEIDLNVPPAEVWKVFSTEEGLKHLGVAQAKMDFRVGGKMQTHYDPKGVIGDEGTIENTILAFEPMRMVSWRITKPPKGFPFMNAYRSTWSVATLTDLGGRRTHLRLATMGYTSDDESRRMRVFFERGNAWVMQELMRSLEAEAPGEQATGAEPEPITSANLGAEAGGDSLESVEAETVVAAPAAQVWKCWTTSEGLRSFLTDAKVELRIGGPFEIYFLKDAPEGQRGSEGCQILSFEPMSMLCFSWNAPPSFGPLRDQRTWVVLHMDPLGSDSCAVTLRQMGFAERAAEDRDHVAQWRQLRAYFNRAWPRVLAALKDHLESGGDR
jgi:uncharacterized protein YndB with AHSA1/START domain